MITKAETGLPSPYQKRAEITFALKMGVWITVAAFSSTTLGAVPSYYLRKHDARGKTREISANVYFNLVRYYTSRRTREA